MKHFQFTHRQHQLIYCIAVAALILTRFLPSAAHAFDGKRKGFVLGVGAGFTPIANWHSDNISLDVSEQGWNVDFLLGYAWDNRNMIVYEGTGCIYRTSTMNNHLVVQGFDSFRWYHYYGPERARFFTSIGLGMMVLQTQYCDIDGNGFGYSAGVGYELFRQVQIGLYYVGGRTSNSYGVKASHDIFHIVVTAVAY